MLQYDEMLSALFQNADPTYREFHKRLLKNEKINVIGVRVPVLRRLAKRWKDEDVFPFSDDYYEVLFVKCAVAAQYPYEKFLKVVDGLVGKIDNWATCDCFAPRCIAAYREEFLPRLKEYLADGREFVKRFALVTLLQNYISEEYLPLIFQSAAACDGTQYYVSMAASWLIAETAVKYYGKTLEFLQSGVLERNIQNGAIKKARESFRLTDAQKAQLNAFKK